MTNIDLDRRLANRRNFDRSLKSKVDKYERLFQVGQIITSEINFDVLFEVIIEQTNRIMETTNCSIFLIDDQNQFLQAFISTDLKKDDIRIPKDNGVAGWVFNNRSAVIIFQKNLVIHMDRKVLQKVCTGLLKNAIENTPDEGLIEIIAESAGEDIRVEFCDHGVGITKENQKYIFGGFFHTQDTNLYSSRKPFEFNAGGSGSDLLRIQAFSERFGFKVNFESDRCRFIPGDADICSGRIELCHHVQNVSECLSSGGSSFRLLFPKSK